MSRSPLLIVVGGALGGVAVTMTMLAVVYQPLLVFVAVPFGAAGYLIWYQGTGRLAARVRRNARRRPSDEDEGGSRWADPRWRQRRERQRAGAGGRRTRRRTASDGIGGGSAEGAFDAMSVEEAYRVLDLPPSSGADAVRAAYRSKVKEVHPDATGGDEDRFKRVKEAYETLDERVL